MTQPLRSLCIYCGSSPGGRPEYVEAARAVGRLLAGRGIGLVYGGGHVGLMGQVAKAALEAGGQVTGVITRRLAGMELAYDGLTALHTVETMHERKAMMAELSDGMIALPGGLGTIEEFFEALTWTQLGMHAKPCGLLNTLGYYDRLLSFLDTTVDEQFVEAAHRDMIQVSPDPAELLAKFETYQPPTTDKAAWVLRMSRDL
jgi:uncharacterized protein (TIGR00730 family)